MGESHRIWLFLETNVPKVHVVDSGLLPLKTYPQIFMIVYNDVANKNPLNFYL